jgi:Zn-dependent protease
VLVIFAGILAHELAHALVARRAGVEIEEIDLWLLGGVARMRTQPQRAVDELRFALAGPAVTAVLVALFGAAALLLPRDAAPALHAFVAYQWQVNAAIVAFNLLPALPLDGGRAARAILWRRTGDLRGATVVTALGGRGLGYAMIGLGTLAALAGYLAGVWGALVGFFLVVAAASERHQVDLAEAVEGLTASDLMSSPALAAPAEVPRIDADAPVQTLLESAAFQRLGRAVVVDADGRPLGVISITDIERCVRGQRRRPSGKLNPGGGEGR